MEDPCSYDGCAVNELLSLGQHSTGTFFPQRGYNTRSFGAPYPRKHRCSPGTYKSASSKWQNTSRHLFNAAGDPNPGRPSCMSQDPLL